MLGCDLLEIVRHQHTEVNSENFTPPFFSIKRNIMNNHIFHAHLPESRILQLSGWSRTLDLAMAWDWMTMDLSTLLYWLSVDTTMWPHQSGGGVGKGVFTYSDVSIWSPEYHPNICAHNTHTHTYIHSHAFLFWETRGQPFPSLRETYKARKHDTYTRDSKAGFADGCYVVSYFRLAAYPWAEDTHPV